jgi:aryl-alcohol dehydrogenase-like predicted oxidoreductase
MGVAEMPEPLRVSLESTKVEYVRLGKSGLKVSVPILGAMSIGDPGWGSWIIDEEKVNDFALLSNGFECSN